jgi:hypothetical protein
MHNERDRFKSRSPRQTLIYAEGRGKGKGKGKGKREREGGVRCRRAICTMTRQRPNQDKALQDRAVSWRKSEGWGLFEMVERVGKGFKKGLVGGPDKGSRVLEGFR